VCINNANQSEPVSIYLDVDPIVPVNGGANANGTLVGLNYDGYSTRPNLPFRADICIMLTTAIEKYLEEMAQMDGLPLAVNQTQLLEQQ
jgi:hypothetical protein